MVRILDRYVLKEVGAPFLISGALFTFFLIIDRIYQLTDLVVTKGVPFPLVAGLLVFMLPSFLSHSLPVALLVAVLLVSGRLAGDLEVLALKASGVSPLRLFRPFVLAAAFVTLATGGLTLLVIPGANEAFQRHLVKILHTRATTGIQERVFNTTFGQIVIYVEEVSASQLGLRGLLVSDERDPKLSRIITARQGRLLTDEERSRITLRLIDGALHESDAGGVRRYRYATFGFYDINLSVEAPFTSAPRVAKPEKNLSLGQLLAATRPEREGQLRRPFEVELHKRFALPLAALVFTLVGFALGIRSHRGGRAIALGGSLAIIASYYLLLTSLEGVALTEGMPSWLAIWAPNLLFSGVGLALLRTTMARISTAWIYRLWRRRARPAPPAGLPAPAPRGSRRPIGSRLIDRYLIREYLTYFGYGLAVAAVLLLVVELLQTLDTFLRVKPPLHVFLEYVLYRIPKELYQGLPAVTLVASIFLFLSLARHHELTALKAAGVSLYRLTLTILLLSVGVSLASVVFQELFLPALNAKAEEVKRIKIRRELPRHLQRRTQIWYRSSDTHFFRIELLDPVGQVMDDVSILELSSDYELRNRLDARQARWTSKGWEFRQGVLREFGPGDQVEAIPFQLTALELPETLDEFTQIQSSPDEMSFLELRAYLNKLQESGHRVGKYMVKLYSKLSFPLVHMVIPLVAIPFALAAPGGGRIIGIGLAIVLTMGYWLVHSLALSFAKADLLPPLLAAWTANVIFAGLGIGLFLRTRT
ncbi:MAG: LPS export ABC transporter permease LptG [Candidatus Rokubacteria bacterium]|nr:LPS export ABC transporter permease LptG [Candidatus Rokubacteria bacterium]